MKSAPSSFQMSLLSMSLFSTSLLAAIVGLSLTFGAAPARAEEKAESKTETKTETKAETKQTAAPEKKADKKTEKKGDKAVTGKSRPMVIIETSKGNIEVELNSEKAPISVENFLKYVDKGHYNGTIFHRVIEDFMIQGGGFTPDMKEKPAEKPIKNEADNGLSNKKGTLAMARTMVVDSATAQFYINVKDNLFLDHRDKSPQGYGYAVFGEVKSGMDVVDEIRKVKTGSKSGYDDVPVEAVTIKSIKRK